LREIERTCCICRSKGDKRSLLRLVAQASSLVVDYHQRLPGRGAYMHPSAECVSRSGQVARWERALRLKAGSLDARQVSGVVMELMTNAHKTGGGADEVASPAKRIKRPRL
jgi:uncharacterized protein